MNRRFAQILLPVALVLLAAAAIAAFAWPNGSRRADLVGTTVRPDSTLERPATTTSKPTRTTTSTTTRPTTTPRLGGSTPPALRPTRCGFASRRSASTPRSGPKDSRRTGRWPCRPHERSAGTRPGRHLVTSRARRCSPATSTTTASAARSSIFGRYQQGSEVVVTDTTGTDRRFRVTETLPGREGRGCRSAGSSVAPASRP